MGRVTERVLVAVMMLTGLQANSGQSVVLGDQCTVPVRELHQLLQNLSRKVSDLQTRMSHQETLSRQMSDVQERLGRLDHLGNLTRKVDRLVELEETSVSDEGSLAELTLRIDRLLELEKKTLSHQETVSQQILQAVGAASGPTGASPASHGQQCTPSGSQLQHQCLSHQQNLSRQMSDLKERLTHQETLSQQILQSSDTCQSSCPSTCKGWKRLNPRSGVRKIYRCQDPITVYCDQTTDNGGWTVFQRRVDDSVDFYKFWDDYRKGFGNLEGNFWLGLDKLHEISTSHRYELRVDLEKWDKTKGHATYSGFYVDGPDNNYALHYDDFTGGNAGDSLLWHRGSQFSTRDRDHDNSGMSCAQQFHGAWWFSSCFDSHLNGEFKNDYTGNWNGMIWRAFATLDPAIKFAEMKMRPM